MEIFLSLASVALLPILIVAFLPKDRAFFDRGIVKGFGLGVYLMLVFVLLSEAIEAKGIAYGFGFLAVGLFISLLIGIYFKEFHHHHGDEERQEIHSKASTWRILISDFFHNIVDGIAIIAGFAISPAVGLIAFAGVLGHQIVQQIGQQILLVEEGIEAKKAILISLVVALSIFLGFFVAESMEAILLAVSAGIVVWKVWTDLVHLKWDKKTATGFVAGALILLAILTSIPHQHGAEHEDETNHEEELEENH